MCSDREPTEPGHSRCAGCAGSACPTEESLDGAPLAGWPLAAASAGLFLGPIILAIVGSLCAGGGQASRLVGALLGLALGMAVAVGVHRWLHAKGKETA